MADSNNQPNWELNSTDGNGRSWQQNDLPKGARTASPSGNSPGGKEDKEGNGYGEYDPRSPEVDEVRKRSWAVSGNGGGDYKNAVLENPAITRSNPIDNDAPAENRVNPHRNSVKKEWFGSAEQGLAGK